jgi:succinate dehydrogenase/fumarate reductase flavoprotein subunit
MKRTLENTHFDIAVIGAGGAGLAAALFAAIAGKSVLIIESTAFVGGTSALSAATHWIPETHLKNGEDSMENALNYLRNAVGNRSSEAMRKAFVAHGATAIAELEAKSELKYNIHPYHPDYISDLEGSTTHARAMEPFPFDGRKLGKLLDLIRPPIPEFTVLGGMMVDRIDIGHLLNLKKNLKSFLYSMKIIARHGLDRLTHKRGTRLVMGNAMIARMLYSLSKYDNVTLLMNMNVTSLAPLTFNNMNITADKIILATGGFNRNASLRKELLGLDHDEWCPGATGHTGTVTELALAMGAKLGEGAMSNAFWAPVSTRKRIDGTTAVFPHFVMDRAKPPFITVNMEGKRFLNESTSYHLFGHTMMTLGMSEAYMITDALGLAKYGAGMIRPNGTNFDEYLADGYLIKGNTINDLAGNLNVDKANLIHSIERYNSFDKIDPDFGRGETEYQRQLGDLTLASPSLGKITQAPFYAVRLHPGDIGAATGLVTDENARVLDAINTPIKGLYAIGNDMHSIMGGTYPGPGITLGPAVVFASIAVKDTKNG